LTKANSVTLNDGRLVG